MRQILRYVGTLWGLQIVTSGFAHLIFDLRWLSIPLAVGFLVLVWIAGRSFPGDLYGRRPGPRRRLWIHGPAALLVGVLWQFPGLLAPIRFVQEEMGVAPYDGISDLYDFICETWHLNIMPLLAAIPPGTVDGYHARYYVGLLAASPALILLFLIAALWPQGRPRWGR